VKKTNKLVSNVVTPQSRFRYGDVEINDPTLNYRQGDPGTVEDFLKTGKVRINYEGEAAT
jgi:hypothetical protein